MKRVLIVIAIILLLCSKSFSYQNCVVLRHDSKATSVIINCQAMIPHIYSGTTDRKTTISFNTNYYDPKTRRVIGLLADSHWKDSLSVYTAVRPCLLIDHYGRAHIAVDDYPYLSRFIIVSQAGPMLVHRGHLCLPKSISYGHLNRDTVRRTRQISVGVTTSGKLIVVYSADWSLDQIAEYLLSLHCIESMKMDGGHSASLTINIPGYHRIYGNRHVVCGISFTEKS